MAGRMVIVFVCLCSIILISLSTINYLRVPREVLSHSPFSSQLVYKSPSASKEYLRNEQDVSTDLLVQRIELLNKAVSDIYCSLYKLTHTGGFCLRENQLYMGGNDRWDVGFCKGLEELIGYKSIGDLGAGIGHYGRCLLRIREPIFHLSSPEMTDKINNDFLMRIGEHIDVPQKIFLWEGFDGAGGVEKLSNGFIKQRDLAMEGLWLGRMYDWILSVEVGEHIPATYEDAFINNLIRHACYGLILTWAGENQPGHHHVNGHTQKYIKDKISAYGFINDEEAELKLREMSTLAWLQNNVMVFRRSSGSLCSNHTN